MRSNISADMAYAQSEAIDALAGEPTDRYGIPLSVVHGPQTALPVWQFIHKLETPMPNPKTSDRPYTHICVLCASDPPVRPLGKRAVSWRKALMRQRMSTNAVSHMQRVHPSEFVTIAEYKQRKREAGLNPDRPKLKKAKKTSGPKKKAVKTHPDETQESTESEPMDKVSVATDVKPRITSVPPRRRTGKTADLLKTWLISSGLPVSTLQDDAFQHLLKLSNSAISALPTALDLRNQASDEFAKFKSFVGLYLKAESHAAMSLPFLSLRHEFRPIIGAAAEVEDGVVDEAVSDQEKAFLSVAVGFIDSQWRRVDLVLAAKEVSRGWAQQTNELVSQTVQEMYGIRPISSYTRFYVEAEADTPSSLAAGGEYESSTSEQEDLLTHTLRRCVVDALDVGPNSLIGGENNVRRILRLLLELLEFFEEPDRFSALAEAGGPQVSFYSASSIENLALSTSTSIGTIAELLRISCARYQAYSLYFQSPERPTVADPELEAAWIQLSIDDWWTVAEIEAILFQLSQFHLECISPPPGVVASSYAMLFRRLLSVTTNASSLKCIFVGDAPVSNCSPAKSTVRRVAKPVDSFTPTGSQCMEQLRQLISERFTSPSTTDEVENEIKAMLLDPRISSKAASLVTDARAFRSAQEALREEHRVIFELIAARQGATGPSIDEEEENDEDDDEISALLMVDGPKQQPPAPPSTTSSGKRSNDAVAEDEDRAWREWQQVYVAWDTLANEGADLFDKGQYNLLKLYHHVDILKWFHDIGQQAHPAAALLARMYLGQQPPPSQALGASLQRFSTQEEADWISGAAQRAEKRCILHHNWHQFQNLNVNATIAPSIAPSNDESNTSIV
ncbi:hypothetical protein PHMEG_00024522 [Phytophthora megakarya]|uniref:Uncharacterized protein n=1 Tax=Phytophthora megakarya TaxID=4795 RepID=A0A225VFZ9_9STRA|nr:hypothetical protein PHMEG_00024522 [Phytophthora megakarya]